VLSAVDDHSRFLCDSLLLHPEWAEELLLPGCLDAPRTVEQMRALLQASLDDGVPLPVDLASFRRRQILRILLRDVSGIATLTETTSELTALADAILQVALARIEADVAQRHGWPQAAGEPARLSVIALGKMGAEELNYSSDIDLMLVYSANGMTSGPQEIANREFFKRVSTELTGLLSAYSAEGLCYRVDLRLRPDGSLGEVCLSLDGAKHYYSQRARDWELQMMIKARVAAGDLDTGRALLEFVAPLTYATSTDFRSIEQLSQTRVRISEKLSAKKARPGAIDVKLEPGGIRDIEFLVQCLQRLHGGSEPWLQHRSTQMALARLHDKGVLTDLDYGRLSSAYQFLRHLEHRLQLDEDRQTHVLPGDDKWQAQFARRMPGGATAAELRRELRQHFDNVVALYERVVYAGSQEAAPPAVRAVPVIDQKAPSLAAAFASAGMERGRSAFEHFLARLADYPAALAELDASPALTASAIELFTHSPHFGEELIRRPDAVLDLTSSPEEWIQGVRPPALPADLRRWYRRGLLRIEAESICRSQPVFDTLAKTARLADAVIARAYGIACEEVGVVAGPLNAIALGRLGMNEFDLGSDADLTFVLADAVVDDLATWTKVAERVVQLIGSYTGDGVLFTIDTRLRPNGSAGPLVLTERAVLDYFAETAEAWESITYLKARVVAGDAEQADRFLQRLQAAYGRRYGQSGNSRLELREMRERLEREQGATRPLKAGRGGYYDIDFLLLYLRLKNAGVYYSYLNTPARIEVLEMSEQLSSADARNLCDAATYYRAIDHGMRVITGHAESRLPRAGVQRDALAALLPRWTERELGDLEQVQVEVRGLFTRYFY
jgi:[glutamine synthetase] adenylyltransferase / [glutamine synthetase]-adenylyl-L-tyrosine phosphorylase